MELNESNHTDSCSLADVEYGEYNSRNLDKVHCLNKDENLKEFANEEGLTVENIVFFEQRRTLGA